jgi:branched-chain amino acid transport system ATP-binding protein
MSILEAEGIHSYYGKSHILHGVSLNLQEGEIVTLLGRNGAGKTTTLRSIVGLTSAPGGGASSAGDDRWPP